VAWGVLCRAWLPSPFFSVMAGCMRWYDLSMFGQVDGKERERERQRESVEKKQIQKPSSSPPARPRKKKKNVVQNITVSGFFFFFWYFLLFCKGTQKWITTILMQKF
jgi:hypothetical protein